MSLITPFDPWKSQLCSCPEKYSLSAYTGCGHGCLYCYASSYIRNFQIPREKKDFLKILEKEIKKIAPNSIITITNSSDPYQPLEKKLTLTRQALKILKNYRVKINIVTKSSLVLRDIDILKEIKKVVVSISLTTLDKTKAKKLEPRASCPQERLATIKKLSVYLPVVVRFDPLIYPLNTGEIKKVVNEIRKAGAKQIITSTYKVKPDNFKRMVGAFCEHKKTWQQLYFKEGERRGHYIYLPRNLRYQLIEKVRRQTLKNNLKFSSCREDLTELNTANCDGSSFLT